MISTTKKKKKKTSSYKQFMKDCLKKKAPGPNDRTKHIQGVVKVVAPKVDKI